MPKSISLAAGAVLIYLGGLLLIQGRSVLMPIVLAILIWHFLNAMHQAIRRIPKVGECLPYALSVLLTAVCVGVLFAVIVSIISNNVTDVIQASSRYSERVQTLFQHLWTTIPMHASLNLDAVRSDLSLQTVVLAVYSVFSTIMSSAVLIGLYVVFLFVEQLFFYKKLAVLFPNTRHRTLVQHILDHIIQDTQVYLGLKTFLSLLIAISSWGVMRAVGLDFAAFWALLIFFLNFIPNIGPIIAAAFPILLSIIQFPTWLPSLLMSGGILLIQFVVSTLLEPKMLSKSLNMSALMMLIALAVWGSIWGILGLFLAVPISVMVMIICAHFPATRPIAILLSQDGHIQNKVYGAS